MEQQKPSGHPQQLQVLSMNVYRARSDLHSFDVRANSQQKRRNHLRTTRQANDREVYERCFGATIPRS